MKKYETFLNDDTWYLAVWKAFRGHDYGMSYVMRLPVVGVLAFAFLLDPKVSIAEIKVEKAYIGTEVYFYPVDGSAGQGHGSTAVTTQLETWSSLSDDWVERAARLFHDAWRSIVRSYSPQQDDKHKHWRAFLAKNAPKRPPVLVP